MEKFEDCQVPGTKKAKWYNRSRNKLRKLLGILGGMGPEAGLEFARILLEKNQAKNDQEHLKFILLNYSEVPDRTAYIIGEGPDPVPKIIEGIKILQKAGATHIIIPCNSAHVFFERIKKGARIFIYNMIEEARLFVEKNLPEVRKTGILATKGVIVSRIYERHFQHLQMIIPNKKAQEKVQNAIYKAAKRSDFETASRILEKIADELIKKGIDALILGCTEVEMVLRKKNFPIPIIKPMEISAAKILREFLAEK